MLVRRFLIWAAFGSWLGACGGSSTGSDDGSGGSSGQAGSSSSQSGSSSGGGKSCNVGGKTYQDGASFPSSDGCNSCSCNDGAVGCTLLACEPAECGDLQAAFDSALEAAKACD